MPKGKPDPNCTECYGKGIVTLFTSSSTCKCVNRKPNFAGIINKKTDLETMSRVKMFRLS